MDKSVKSGRTRWKVLLNIATFLALAVTIYLIRRDLLATFRKLPQARAWALVLIIPLEFINYHAQAKLYQHLFKIVGHKLPYRFLFLASLELNFVNHVFPSGGAAGLSYFGLKLKNDQISGAKATTVQVMKLMLTYFSFVFLIFLSVFFLALRGRVNRFTILIAGIFSTLLIVGSLLFLYIMGKKERITAFFAWVTRRINSVIRLVARKREAISMDKAEEVFADFHASISRFKRQKGEIRWPLLYATLANSTEIAVVYVVFIAFGHLVNVGAVILAYGIANFAGAVSILPGGVGIYEALMTAILLSTGVSAAISLPIIITYRVLNTLLQIPPGYYLYQRRLVKGNSNQAVA